MTILEMDSEVCNLRAEEERILASFTQRLIEIAAVSGAHETASSPIAALNAMRLPAIALDQHGLVADVNAAADAVFDQNINIKDRRLFVRNPDARTLLKNAVDQLKELPRLDSLALEPVIVPRMDKLPVIVRIWPFEGAPGQDVRATFDVQCLGTKARTVRGDPRQDIPADTIGSKGRLHHRAGSSSRYRRPGVEDIPGDGAKSVEIRLCQDGHASPKRTCRVAFASRVTDSRLIQISRWKRRANSLSVFKPRASGVARVRRVTGFFPVRGDGHPSGVIPHRNRRHHHVGSRVDHRNIVVDFIRDALEGARTRRCLTRRAKRIRLGGCENVRLRS